MQTYVWVYIYIYIYIYIYRYTGWNDKIVALEKTTWIHFRLMKTGFLFFVADHLLVGMLCTNSKSDRSLLSCLKVTQCSTSEIGYGYGLWLWFQVRATSCHLTSSKSAWKSIPTCTWMCWRLWWSPGAIRWPVAPARGLKRPRLGFKRSTTTLYISLTGTPPPSTWTRWTTSFGHTSRTSPTWPPTTPKPAWSPPSTEYSLRNVPSSESVSRRWLRLKASTLNRCQLYNIIKLPELIFVNKSFKIKL